MNVEGRDLLNTNRHIQSNVCLQFCTFIIDVTRYERIRKTWPDTERLGVYLEKKIKNVKKWLPQENNKNNNKTAKIFTNFVGGGGVGTNYQQGDTNYRS